MAEIHRETIQRTTNEVRPGIYAWFNDPEEAAAAALPGTAILQTSPACRGSRGLWRARVEELSHPELIPEDEET